MKRRAQSSISYLLLFAVAIIFVLFTFRSYKNTPHAGEKIISSATRNYSTTASYLMNSNAA